MDQEKLTEAQQAVAMDHIGRLVALAAEPDRDGTRMSAADLKTLAEDAAAAIVAGRVKLTAGG